VKGQKSETPKFEQPRASLLVADPFAVAVTSRTSSKLATASRKLSQGGNNILKQAFAVFGPSRATATRSNAAASRVDEDEDAEDSSSPPVRALPMPVAKKARRTVHQSTQYDDDDDNDNNDNNDDAEAQDDASASFDDLQIELDGATMLQFEDRFRCLQASIDASALTGDSRLATLEGKLEAISKQLAKNNSNNSKPAPADRVAELEARLDQHLAKAGAPQAGKAATDRVAELEARLDALSKKEKAPPSSGVPLEQLRALEATHAAELAAANKRADALEQRLAELESETAARAVEFLSGNRAALARLSALEASQRQLADRVDDVEARMVASASVEQHSTQLSSLEDRLGTLPDTLEARMTTLASDFDGRIAALQRLQRDEGCEATELARQCEHLFNTLNTVQERVDALDVVKGVVDSVVTAQAELRLQLQQTHHEWPHTPAAKATNATAAVVAAPDSALKTAPSSAPSSGTKKQTPAMDAQNDGVLPLNVVQYVTRELTLLRQQLEAKMKLTSQPLVMPPQRHVSRKLEGQFK
jgi:chromosome segregation ATPase